MSAVLIEMQSAIVTAVKGTPALMSKVSGIYDRVPKNPWGTAEGYITFGPADVIREGDDDCQPIDNISLQLDVWSRKPGRIHCAEVLELLRKVVTSVELSQHPVAARGDPYQQIRPDPDGLTMHGILRIEWACQANG